MLTIENIDKIKYETLMLDDKPIFCSKVELIEDSQFIDYNSYTFDFDIGLSGVELVLWLKRVKDTEYDGWKMENNLVDGSITFQIDDVTTIQNFVKLLQIYIDRIEPEIKRNFFN